MWGTDKGKGKEMSSSNNGTIPTLEEMEELAKGRLESEGDTIAELERIVGVILHGEEKPRVNAG